MDFAINPRLLKCEESPIRVQVNLMVLGDEYSDSSSPGKTTLEIYMRVSELFVRAPFPAQSPAIFELPLFAAEIIFEHQTFVRHCNKTTSDAFAHTSLFSMHANKFMLQSS